MLTLVLEFDKVIDALRSGTPADELEHDRLEFKQEDTSFKRTLEILADAVVCFANADGGTLVVGVRDRAGQDGSIVGVSPSLTRDVVIKGIFDRTQPSLSVPVEQRVVDGKPLLVVTVPRGATFYANAKGTATRRLGTECVPFPPDQQRQALAARGLHDWSVQPSGRDISDVDPNEMRRLRRLLAAAGKDDLARAADELRLLRDLRLCDSDGGLYRAGLLLVGEEDAIRSAIPTYEYSYQFRQSPGSEATSRFRGRTPLLSGLELLLGAVETRRTVQPINVAGGVQLQVYDYPTNAVRELVVNALVHRDYETEGAVSVEQSPESLTVSSPGGLVFGVTPNNILTHPSTPRNRLLLEAVTTLQVAERTGQGVDRVYRELLRVGKPPPRYTDTDTDVRVVVEGGTGDDAFVRYLNDLDTEPSADVDVLLALAHLRERRSITAQTLAVHIQRSVPEAQLVLDRMAHQDLVEPTKRTARKPFPSYGLRPNVLTALGRAVRYYQRKPDAGKEKVVEHVREYGHITNQTLRRLFDLDVYAARDLLRDLQRRDVLVKLDQQARGPGVRYGPGPAFPTRPRNRRGNQG